MDTVFLRRLSALIAVAHGSRRGYLLRVTAHPTSLWTTQAARNLLMEVGNRVTKRSDLGLRLAEEGNDIGRLVTVTDDARPQLVQPVVAREEGEPQTRFATRWRCSGSGELTATRNATTTTSPSIGFLTLPWPASN